MKILLLLIFLPVFAQAELGAASKYLSSEPATLFDVVMIRLETLSGEFEKRNGFVWAEDGETKFSSASVSPVYDSDDDKIYIYMSAMNSDPDEEQMEEGCRYGMSQMNIWLLKSWSKIFHHAGQQSQSLPPDVYESLTNLIELRCAFTSSSDSSKGRFWAHRTIGNLGSDDMTIGRWKMRNE